MNDLAVIVGAEIRLNRACEDLNHNQIHTLTMKLVLALCLGAAAAFQARAPPLTESYAVDQLTAPSSAPQAPTKIGASQIANVVKPLVAAGVLTVALPAFAADVDAGEQVFSGNCAACHAGGQNVIMPEKTLELVRAVPVPPPQSTHIRPSPRVRSRAHARAARRSRLSRSTSTAAPRKPRSSLRRPPSAPPSPAAQHVSTAVSSRRAPRRTDRSHPADCR